MPVLIAFGAFAALGAVALIADISSGRSPRAQELRKKLGDALNPGGIRGSGGSVVLPARSPFAPSGASAYPGGATGDPPSAAVAVLTAISNAAQTFTSFAAPQGQTSPQIVPAQSPADQAATPAIAPAATPSPLATPISWIAPSTPNNPAAPTVPMLSPTAAAPQYYPPSYTPPEPLPPESPHGGVQGPDAQERNQPAPYVAPYNPSGPSLDPGFINTPSNAGVQPAAPPPAAGPGPYLDPGIYSPPAASSWIAPTPPTYSPPAYSYSGPSLDPGYGGYSAPNAGPSAGSAPVEAAPAPSGPSGTPY